MKQHKMIHVPSIFRNFFWPELKMIARRRWSLVFLVLIVVASLFSIGFSNGALTYMKDKMDNPFIKFINVNLPFSHEDLNDYKKDLRDPNVMSRFGIEGINQVPTWYSSFKSVTGENYTGYVRMIDPKSDLHSFIANNPELTIKQRKGLDIVQSPWSCIVTEDFLSKLNRGQEKGFITFVALFGEEGEETQFPIPIAMAVKQLPDNHDILVGSELFFALRGDYFDNNPFDLTHPGHEKYLSLFFPSGKTKDEFSRDLNQAGLDGYDFLESPSCYEGFLVTKSTGSGQVSKELDKARGLEAKVLRFYDPYAVYSASASPPELDPDKLVINMNTLDSVRTLKEYMLSRHKLKIDLNTVEAKENFNVFSKFIKILSLVLASFSIILIIYVVSALMQSHIEKNKKNLGTLKAFGMSNRTISLIYGGISFFVISGIFLLGLLFTSAIGNALATLLARLFQLNLEVGTGIFELHITAPLLLAFIGTPLLVLYLTIGSMLRGKTPGDLIYGRK